MSLAWDVVSVDKPDDVNVVIGQAHFIKAVEDLHEAMVGVSPSLRFGLAFLRGFRAPVGSTYRQRWRFGRTRDPHCAGHRGRA